MNNYSCMQSSNTQGYTISNVPSNQEHTRIITDITLKIYTQTLIRSDSHRLTNFASSLD